MPLVASRRPSPAVLPALIAAGLLAACGGGGGSSSSAAPAVDTVQQAQDIAAARALFAVLRDDAAALGGGATATGAAIPQGVKTLGLSMQGDAMAAVNAVADSTRLHQMAFSLWQDWRAGATASPVRGDAAAFADCTVQQSAFPASFGSTSADFVSAAAAASSAANASWVTCSQATQALPAAGAPRYRQTWFYDMGAAVAAGTWPASVGYAAVTRRQFADAATGTVYERNLGPALTGTTGFPGGVAAGGFVLRGGLPPLADGSGTLLADRYGADVTGSVSARAGGGRQIAFAGGSVTLVPAAGATSGTLTVALDTGTVAARVNLPSDNASVAQRLTANGTLAATVSDARGRLVGSFSEDLFAIDAAGAIRPGHVKLVGDAALTPAGAAAPVSFLSGALELTAASTTVVTFDGSLVLPGRPQGALKAAVTATSATADALQGSLTQDGLTVTFSGDRGSSFTSIAFTASNDAKTTVASNAARADVTVGGRRIGYVDVAAQTVVYVDNTTQSLR